MKKLLVLLSLLISSAAFAQSEGSPFEDVLYDFEPYVKVQHEGQIYHLLAINGMRRSTIMEKCEATYYMSCHKMFAENFVEMSNTIGLMIGTEVSIELYRMTDHTVHTFDHVSVTAEKRQSVIQNREFRGEF